MFQRVNVAGQDKFVPFEQTILWLRESSTKIVLRHDDVEVNDGSTFNDFYGYLTSLEGAVKDEVKKNANHYRVGRGDRLSVDLDIEIIEVAVMLTESELPDAQNAYKNAYLQIEWHKCRWYTSDVPAARDDADPWIDRYPRFVCDRKYFEKKAIFSTRTDPIGNMPKNLATWIKHEREIAGTKGTLKETAVPA